MKINKMIQEFVAGEEKGYDSAHASTLIQLKNGNILAAWFGGSWEGCDDVDIWGARRVNGVWETPRVFVHVRDVALWNPVLFQKEDGGIILFYKVGKEIELWKTWYVESYDNGQTFSEPKELVEGDTSNGRGPVKNKPIRLTDGTILAPASWESETWDAFVDISKDDCKTWATSQMVPLRRSSYDIQMVDRPYNKHYIYGKGVIQPTLWQDEKGEVHMFLRTTSSKIFRSDSTDGGRTWSLAYDTGLPNNNSGIDLVKMKNGMLVLVYNPRENLPNYYKGPRTPLVVAVSKDNGENFEELMVLEDKPGNYCYPAIICNEDNKVMITYTWNRENIVYCEFELEELY